MMLNNSLVKKTVTVFASHQLSCVLFFFLFLLTVLGTIDEKYIGLYETQKKYFESLFLIYKVGPVSIPLPGVYLVLILLFINTIVGTVKRIKFKPAKYGVIIIHFSMVLLFAGSFITFKFSDDGQMTLQEGQSSSRFVSYHEWEVAIIDVNNSSEDKEYVFDLNFDHQLKNLVFTDTNLPFAFEVIDYQRHAIVQPKGPMFTTEAPIVNGFFINPLDLEKENEKNTPAVLFKITDKTKKSDASNNHIISGATSVKNSLQLHSADKNFIVCLRKKSWEVPFKITLDRVERDLYPGTMQAQAYRSFIRKTESGVEEKKEVYMNHPYRYMDFIFFQSGYMEDPNTKLKYSTFAVVRNPTDHVPLISCILISIGLIVHFMTNLIKFLNKELNQ